MNFSLKVDIRKTLNILLVIIMVILNLSFTITANASNSFRNNLETLAPHTSLGFQSISKEKQRLAPILSSIMTLSLVGSSLFAYFSYHAFLPEVIKTVSMFSSVLLFQTFSHEFAHFLAMRGLDVKDSVMVFKYKVIPAGVTSEKDFEKLTIPQSIFALAAGPTISLINVIVVTSILLSNDFLNLNNLYSGINIKVLPVAMFFIASSVFDFMFNLFGSYFLARKGHVLGDGAMIYVLREILNYMKYNKQDLNTKINNLPEDLGKLIKESAGGRMNRVQFKMKNVASLVEISKLFILDYRKNVKETVVKFRVISEAA